MCTSESGFRLISEEVVPKHSETTIIKDTTTMRRMKTFKILICVVVGTVLTGLLTTLHAQRPAREYAWVEIGSLRNFYSQKGWEVEVDYPNSPQQFGLQWPAQYQYQDMQAAKGMWMGATNWTDPTGINYAHKVVHIGPRVRGDGEFFPLRFDYYAKFEPTRVFADGDPAYRNPPDFDGFLDTLKSDIYILNVSNSSMGVTLTRKIYAFGQQYHSNYHVFDMTFKNTGNTDYDDDIELPNQTITGFYVYFQYRYSVCAEVRYLVNNSAGWGINTMNDARGFPPDIANPAKAGQNDVKAQFAWHGYHNQANKPTPGSYPNASSFDNIGAPIFDPSLSAGYVNEADTNWRLGGAQFVGNVHIYAPVSATDPTNDPNQPSTSNYIASDEPATSGNSQFIAGRMTDEYNRLMSAGHSERHAWLVDPAGDFANQTTMANIGAGSPGGWSSCIGYGPYTLAPGDSIRIVFAEGADGLTRPECIRVGKQYKDGTIDTEAKNDSVFLGLPRLLDTFRRAVANFNSGFNIPEPPYPPSNFNVTGGGNRIRLTWDPNPSEGANGFVGYKLYRALGRYDSTYHLIFQAGGPAPSDPSVQYSPTKVYSFDDTTAIRGFDYYYYVTSLGDPSANTGVGNTPPGALESSRFYTQTYLESNLKRPAGTSYDAIRIAPNPYVLSSSEGNLRFPGQPDRIAFYNIPGNCTIKIFTELGELIYEIDHNDGTGDAYWNSITSSSQVVVSGIYLVVIEDRDSGQKIVKKLIIVR